MESCGGDGICTDPEPLDAGAPGHGSPVRDSKDRAAGTQFHGPAEWAAFVAALKNGHLGG
ncbi:DUF397 domain-containing protein [Streptomyces platensis]|uniref:DUF397 domain-containing protein n=1 Tax=Streptomyces platensis TaxID=58346 RepID=UPI003868E7AC|nr:DUF397 domain-containing protein [Streptomyces platensis]